MNRALVITAAGSSTRLGSGLKKEYLSLPETAITPENGRISILSACLYTFLSTTTFSQIIITVPASGEASAKAVLAEDIRLTELYAKNGIKPIFIEGGKTRQASVHCALEALNTEPYPKTVFIHDGARPWISSSVIQEVIKSTDALGAAVPALESVDTQKETDEAGKIIRHLEKKKYSIGSNTQGFLFTPLLEAHRLASKDGKTYTDDTEIWARYAGDVFICQGDRANRKVTFKEDLE